ncbi:hypothetical protein MMC10_008702 [Thelotrema lepadinum]|nr:hypothetical protein [Thelotrema lepadinum]
MGGVLDSVPDLIREAALENGMRNEETPLNTIGSLGAVPPELKKAYISGDYAPVQKCTDPTAKDLNPIHGNIREFVEFRYQPTSMGSILTAQYLGIDAYELDG